MAKDELIEKLKAELGVVEEEKSEPKEDIVVSEDSEAVKAAEKPEKKEAKKSATQKTKTKYHSKKYLDASEGIDKTVFYSLKEAVGLAKKASYASFGGIIEAHISTNVKNLKGSVSLPFFTGKKLVILAFGKGAQESGADMVGDDAKLELVKNGKVDFDALITTPEWMGKIAPLAKVLGPKGLMPNPKNGTINEDLSKAVQNLQSGRTDYKTEQNGKVMHLSLGKVDQADDELAQNIKVLVQTIGKTKIKKLVLSPTMGQGVKLDITSV